MSQQEKLIRIKGKQANNTVLPYPARLRKTRELGAFVPYKTLKGVYGGDFAYYYKGDIKANGNNLAGKIEVGRHSEGVSIFGPLDNFQLDLTGVVNGDQIRLTGNIAGNPQMKISIDGKRVSDL